MIILLAGACSVDHQNKTWEPLDYVALEEAMRSPTGKLAEVSPADLLVDMPALVAALIQTIVLFDRIRELARPPDPDGGVDAGAPDAGPPDAGPPADLGPAVDPSEPVEGASIYFKLACPGADISSQERDFAFGDVRIDSPTINSTSIDVTLIRGHLLLSFEACQTWVGTLSGESPAYYDFATNWLGVQLRLSFQLTGDEDPRPVDVGGVMDTDRIRLLLQDVAGRTYVLTVRLDDGVAVSLAGSDQVIGCEYTDNPPAIACGSS